MAYDAERQRIPDNLDTVLPSGRTVREAAASGEQARQFLDEAALAAAMKHGGGERKLNRLARLFTAGHGR